MAEETFLRCRETGRVQYGGTGYVFWSPCHACGWNNNNKEKSFSEHWEVIKIKMTEKKKKEIYKTQLGFSAWVNRQIISLAGPTKENKR